MSDQPEDAEPGSAAAKIPEDFAVHAAKAVAIDYTSEGPRRDRRQFRVAPIAGSFRFGDTEHHPGAQWLFDAIDLETREVRTFALAGLHRTLLPGQAFCPSVDRYGRCELLAGHPGQHGLTGPLGAAIWPSVRQGGFPEHERCPERRAIDGERCALKAGHEDASHYTASGAWWTVGPPPRVEPLAGFGFDTERFDPGAWHSIKPPPPERKKLTCLGCGDVLFESYEGEERLVCGACGLRAPFGLRAFGVADVPRMSPSSRASSRAAYGLGAPPAVDPGLAARAQRADTDARTRRPPSAGGAPTP